MTEYVERLFALIRRSAGSRTTLTPGDLYRRMSLEFREHRSEGHGGCVMPMVVFQHSSGGRVNWGIETLTSHCVECRRLARRIARRYATRFDLRASAAPMPSDVSAAQ